MNIASVVCLLALAACCAASAQDIVPTETVEAKDTLPPQKSFWKRMFSVEAVTSTVPGAIVQQFHDWPDEWGKHRQGFEKRVGSLYGQFVVGVAIEDTVKAIDHEDTRYRRLGTGNFFRRTGHVITDTVTARNQDGHRMMSWSMPANAYGSWAIATLWSPREFRNAESIFEWGSAGVGTFAATNMLKEFWPDVKAVFHKKK